MNIQNLNSKVLSEKVNFLIEISEGLGYFCRGRKEGSFGYDIESLFRDQIWR